MKTQDNSRRASLQEAKALRPDNMVVMPHDSSDSVFTTPEGAGMFLALENRPTGRDPQQVVKRMEKRAAEMGLELDVLSVEPGFNPGTFKIWFLLTESKQSEASPFGTFNTEPIVFDGGRVVRHVPNMSLKHEYWWVDVMNIFAEQKEFTDYTTLNLPYPSSVQRLFKEGLLERNPYNFNQFKLSPAGEVWLAAAPAGK